VSDGVRGGNAPGTKCQLIQGCWLRTEACAASRSGKSSLRKSKGLSASGS
jgi:hypothetical protein